MNNIISFVKSFALGMCRCYYINGCSTSGNYDPITGKYTPGHYDPGTLVKCNKCRAIAALKADGIDFEDECTCGCHTALDINVCTQCHCNKFTTMNGTPGPV